MRLVKTYDRTGLDQVLAAVAPFASDRGRSRSKIVWATGGSRSSVTRSRG